MKNFLLALTVLIFCSINIAEASDPVTVSGVVTLRNGTQIKATKIEMTAWDNKKNSIEFETIEGTKSVINVSKIANIHFQHVDKSYSKYDKRYYFGYQSDIIVTLQNGKEAHMKYMNSKTGIDITYKDDFSDNIVKDSHSCNGADAEKGQPTDIININFTGVGDIKTNSKGKYYPVSYNYDPYTGEALHLEKK